MTPTIDHYLNQWARYKVALVVFFTMNAFSIILALVLGVNHFVVKHNLANTQLQTIANLETADQTLAKLTELQTGLQVNLLTDQKTNQKTQIINEKKYTLLILTHSLELKNLLQQLNSAQQEIQLNDDLSTLLSATENPSQFISTREQIENIKKQMLHNLKLQIESSNNSTQLLIVIGLLTLIFGLILPSMIFYLMSRGLNKIRLEIQKSAIEFIKDWGKIRDQFGNDAFKNAEFWLQIILLLGSFSGRMSSHPLAQISSEFAHLIRLELQKNKGV